jgi:hypothetical protein
MRIYEIIPELKSMFSEDADALGAIADTNMKMSRRQKKSSQIQKTKDKLSDQQRQLTDISRQ